MSEPDDTTPDPNDIYFTGACYRLYSVELEHKLRVRVYEDSFFYVTFRPRTLHFKCYLRIQQQQTTLLL